MGTEGKLFISNVKLKPRVFIGSSSEGKEKARFVKEQLHDIANCQIWDEGFFENNKSSFESLAEGSILFDFGILLATKDDTQLKRDKLESVARDNVIFEFGLYIGRLGKNRSFFLKQKGLDLPSDLYGITLPEFTTSDDTHGKTLEQACADIKLRILEIWKTYELSLIPSTVLAVGYFDNFVSKVCSELMQSPTREVDGRNYADFKLHIIIPDELPDDFTDQVIAYLSEKHLDEMVVRTTTRKYNFYLDYSKTNGQVLQLYDLPTTLGALKRAIEMAMPKAYIGETNKERILKRKEMNNFFKTLKYLISKNSITKSHVMIQLINVQ